MLGLHRRINASHLFSVLLLLLSIAVSRPASADDPAIPDLVYKMATGEVTLDPTDGGAKMVFGRVGGPDSVELPSAVKIDYELVPFFKEMAAPDFDLHYMVLVTSQFGSNKLVVYGFGELAE